MVGARWFSRLPLYLMNVLKFSMIEKEMELNVRKRIRSCYSSQQHPLYFIAYLRNLPIRDQRREYSGVKAPRIQKSRHLSDFQGCSVVAYGNGIPGVLQCLHGSLQQDREPILFLWGLQCLMPPGSWDSSGKADMWISCCLSLCLAPGGYGQYAEELYPTSLGSASDPYPAQSSHTN